MNTEKLLDEILEENDKDKLNVFFEHLSDQWVFFFFTEKDGKNTPSSKENIESVLFVDKDNPINIPLINNDDGCNGVIYTNIELAKRSAEFSCKIGKMKGKSAFKLFLDIAQVDSIAIQGNNGYILPHRKDLEKYVESNA